MMIKRMMKKIIFLMLAVMLTASSAFVSYANESKVYDKAGILTSDEITELQQAAVTMVQDTGMDFVILTADSKGGKSSRQYAEDFYDENGFGTDSEKSGVVLFLDMEERSFFIVTTGEAIRYYTDERIYNMTDGDDDLYICLANGQYAGAFVHAMGKCFDYYKMGIEAGQYGYDEDTGKKVNMNHKELTFFEIIIALAVPFVLAFSRIKAIKNEYGLKAASTDASSYKLAYSAASAFAFAAVTDELISQNVSKRYIPPVVVTTGSGSGGSSGRSTIHTGSSGTFHGGGGGGRHF